MPLDFEQQKENLPVKKEVMCERGIGRLGNRKNSILKFKCQM